MKKVDVIIIGASASGLMCAIEAGKRGRQVLVLDHANKAGKKILMSGGGKCNFTNYEVSAENYISHNPHFCKSALSRFTQWDFIAMVAAHDIPYHERSHGQLFCDNSSKDILTMLLKECQPLSVEIQLNREIKSVVKNDNGYYVIDIGSAKFAAKSLVIATGGLSIPKMGATAFGYQLAEQFGHRIHPTRAGLVPFTLQPDDKKIFSPLSGIAVDAVVSSPHKSFRENILFTHRGLSGPVILQISSYWQPGEAVEINYLPDLDLFEYLQDKQKQGSQQKIKSILGHLLPQRLVSTLLDMELLEKSLQDASYQQFQKIAGQLQSWKIKPNGTEGYRTAEVTLGGVDCHEISSKTMESGKSTGLYFVGEVLDVTGWLGGYNFQWAWSSGWCAGQYV